jgi:hypothetical protein
MNRTTILGLAMAMAALSSCNRAATNEIANGSGNVSAAPANAAAPPANATADAGAKPEAAAPPEAAAAPAGGGETLDRAYLVGRWTDDGDCSAVTEFRADGTFLFPWGDTGQWNLAGDQLTLSGNTSPFRIRVIDRNTIERTGAGGSSHRATRCT